MHDWTKIRFLCRQDWVPMQAKDGVIMLARLGAYAGKIGFLCRYIQQLLLKSFQDLKNWLTETLDCNHN
jgi:hypothetical protein